MFLSLKKKSPRCWREEGVAPTTFSPSRALMRSPALSSSAGRSERITVWYRYSLAGSAKSCSRESLPLPYRLFANFKVPTWKSTHVLALLNSANG